MKSGFDETSVDEVLFLHLQDDSGQTVLKTEMIEKSDGVFYGLLCVHLDLVDVGKS